VNAPGPQPQRVLLAKVRAIGDSVLTLPSLNALKDAWPRAGITVLCPPASAEIFRGDPRCEGVLTYDRAALRPAAAQAAFLWRIRRSRFDVAVCLHASFRTALVALASGAPRRVVRNHSGPDYFSRPKSGEAKVPKNIIQRDFDALRALGLDPRDESPRMVLRAEDRAAALERWKAWRIRGKAVLLFPGAGKAEKRWPLERFAALGRALKAAGRTPVFLSGPGEEGADGAAKACGGRADRTASLRELGALCALAGAAIGNDSGPRHIAAACGARTLTLFGPEGLEEWHPYRERDGHRALQAPSGKVVDLETGKVAREARAWLRAQ